MPLSIKIPSNKACMNITMAVIVRMMLMTHTVMAYWRVLATYLESPVYLFLMLILMQVTEGAYTIVSLKGVENKRFSFCLLCYILSTVPAICLLEMDRLNQYNLAYHNKEGKGVAEPAIELKPDLWVTLIEQVMLFVMILARLMLPRGKLTRDQLSQLLLVNITTASDVSELFVLFNEKPVREDRSLTVAILVVWCFSMLLFAVVLTAANTPYQQISSTLHYFILQDFPYLCLRVYILVWYKVITYNIVFFVMKNIFFTILLMYRLFALLVKEEPPSSDNSEAGSLSYANFSKIS